MWCLPLLMSDTAGCHYADIAAVLPMTQADTHYFITLSWLILRGWPLLMIHWLADCQAETIRSPPSTIDQPSTPSVITDMVSSAARAYAISAGAAARRGQACRIATLWSAQGERLARRAKAAQRCKWRRRWKGVDSARRYVAPAYAARRRARR